LPFSRSPALRSRLVSEHILPRETAKLLHRRRRRVHFHLAEYRSRRIRSSDHTGPQTGFLLAVSPRLRCIPSNVEATYLALVYLSQPQGHCVILI